MYSSLPFPDDTLHESHGHSLVQWCYEPQVALFELEKLNIITKLLHFSKHSLIILGTRKQVSLSTCKRDFESFYLTQIKIVRLMLAVLIDVLLETIIKSSKSTTYHHLLKMEQTSETCACWKESKVVLVCVRVNQLTFRITQLFNE